METSTKSWTKTVCEVFLVFELNDLVLSGFGLHYWKNINKNIHINMWCLELLLLNLFSPYLGGTFPELAMLSDSVGGWKQYNVSHVSRQGGNLTESPVNRTLMLPGEELDPLGGHTVWQVTINRDSIFFFFYQKH